MTYKYLNLNSEDIALYVCTSIIVISETSLWLYDYFVLDKISYFKPAILILLLVFVKSISVAIKHFVRPSVHDPAYNMKIFVGTMTRKMYLIFTFIGLFQAIPLKKWSKLGYPDLFEFLNSIVVSLTIIIAIYFLSCIPKTTGRIIKKKISKRNIINKK